MIIAVRRARFRNVFISVVLMCWWSAPAAANSGDVRSTKASYTDGTSSLTVMWDPPFPDTNYTAVCTAETVPSDFLLPVITSRSSGSMNVVPTDLGETGTLDCVAVPDSDESDIRHIRTPFTGNVTVLWSPPFPDINYTAVCTAESQSSPPEFSSVITAVTPDSVGVIDGGLASGTMHCIAIPDSDTSDIGRSRVAVSDSPSTVAVPWNQPIPGPSYAAVCSDEVPGATGSDSAIAIVAGSETPQSLNVIPEITSGDVECIGVPLGTALLPPPTSETITQPLNPTAPNLFSFDNNVHNLVVQYPAGTSFSGINMTVTAAQTLQTIFQERVAETPYADSTCIGYQGENGYCEIYQVTCSATGGTAISCPSEPTPTIDVKTSYDTTEAIINPGFLTTPIGTNDWTNIFTSFSLQRIDPTTRGRTVGFSEFVAVDLGAANAQGEGSLTFLPPLQSTDNRIFPRGVPIPVEFQLTSVTQPGIPVSDATAGITVAMVTDAAGNANPDIVLEKSAAFTYQRGKYVYVLNTRKYAPGVYNVTVYGNAFPAQQVQFTLPEPTSGVKLKTTLQSLTLDSGAHRYVAVLDVANTGGVSANGVTVILSALDLTLTSTMLPYSVGDIGPGTSATVTLTYPSAAGHEGYPGVLTLLEAFAGGVRPTTIPVELPW